MLSTNLQTLLNQSPVKSTHKGVLKYFTGLHSSSILSFNMQRQTGNNWCWAATSTSVSLFYNVQSTWSQCKVATHAFPTESCCSSPIPLPCDIPWYLDLALSITGNFINLLQPLNFKDIKRELRSGRVIGARIEWVGGNGHFVVIYGYRTVAGINYLYIDDPITGKSNLTEKAFRNKYNGTGRWTHSYLTH